MLYLLNANSIEKMRTRIIQNNHFLKEISTLKVLLTLMLSLFLTFSYSQTLKKGAPYSAIEWNLKETSYPKVEIDHQWYFLYSINDMDVKEIIEFCKKTYDKKAYKRFNEDLIEVFITMHKPLSNQVDLKLGVFGEDKTIILKDVEMTLENRQKIAIAYRAKNAVPVNKTITKAQAIEDILQLKEIVEKHSSYLELTGFDYGVELDKIIAELPEEVNIANFALELEKFIGYIGDRHSRIKAKGNTIEIDKYLPFMVAPLDGKVVALKANDKIKKQYDLYLEKYPYLKAIDGIAIEEILEKNAWRHKQAPKASRLVYSLWDLRYLGLQYYKLDKELSDELIFTFTNGEKDKDVKISPLNEIPNRWRDKLEWEVKQDTFRILESNIGYIKISEMNSPRRAPAFFEELPKKMREYKNTDALIIDIRNNGGGTRDILNVLAPYFISPDAQPWVANMAKLRCDQNFDEDMESMSGRYLFSYDSEHFTDKDREAIDTYMEGFKANWDYDESKFSGPFYMVFTPDKGENHYYYDKPVYVLVNERCFSAASVFTTALSGMGKVKIVGVNTDGSSGRSNYFDLNHSKINLKLSTMISFQRNGKTLDSNGTEPDVFIPRDMEQVLGRKDSQLNKLLELIIGDKL